ncbi:MAG: DUF2442 domain-containing protein [Chloroflexi bacterium]|nr:DUF2442 domain-containing protein [Chloroflexota bacterium]
MSTVDDREAEDELAGPDGDLVRPVAVEARGKYRIWLKYSDGAEGEVDLSDCAGKGVFKVWDEPGVFESVHLDEYNAVQWTDDLDMCPVALYMDLTDKTWEEVYPDAPA